MSSAKHGKIVSWKTLYVMPNSYSHLEIQKATYEDKTEAITIYQRPYGSKHKPITLDYGAMRKIIEGLVSLYNKTEVEKSLGIKIDE